MEEEVMEALIDFGWVMLGFVCGVVFTIMAVRGRSRMYEDGYRPKGDGPDKLPQVLREGYRPKGDDRGPGKPPQGGSGMLRPPPNVGAPCPRPPRPKPREVLE